MKGKRNDARKESQNDHREKSKRRDYVRKNKEEKKCNGNDVGYELLRYEQVDDSDGR